MTYCSHCVRFRPEFASNFCVRAGRLLCSLDNTSETVYFRHCARSSRVTVTPFVFGWTSVSFAEQSVRIRFRLFRVTPNFCIRARRPLCSPDVVLRSPVCAIVSTIRRFSSPCLRTSARAAGFRHVFQHDFRTLHLA